MSTDGLRGRLLSRSSRLLGMATRLAGQEARHALKKKVSTSLDAIAGDELKTRIAQAKVLAGGLSKMKGAAMKAGQLLSIDSGDLLPPEALEILSTLQGKAEPVDFEIIRGVILGDLGPEKMARLEALDPTAAAAASIGQVHTARVDGTKVAVKVQYPGIAESIDSDISLLETLSKTWLTVTRSHVDLGEAFEELRVILHLEADYLRERENMIEYRRLVEGDSRFVVPRALPEVSGARVLTMSWEEGVPLSAWMNGHPSLALRTAVARAVLDLYCMELFDWGVVQTDPNHANFLIRPETEQVVLLDFGATLRYDARFRAWYRELLKLLATRDRARIVAAGIDHELISAKEGSAAKELFADLMLNAMEPFEPARQPFDFRDPDFSERSRKIGFAFVRSLEYSPPPRQLLFLHRKLGGVFQTLRRLEVQLDLRPYWARMGLDA